MTPKFLSGEMGNQGKMKSSAVDMLTQTYVRENQVEMPDILGLHRSGSGQERQAGVVHTSGQP